MPNTVANRDAEVITLGSGTMYIAEYTGSVPTRETICVDDNLLGRIKGGASLSYKPTYYTETDDGGIVSKTIITDEEAMLKSGVLTWNGKTLAKLCATARVTESAGVRTVKIGGIGQNNGKSYVLCFLHEDAVDGDCWVIIRGVNQSGFELAFVKDKGSVIDAEFKALPMDTDGTLIEYNEEMTTTAGA